MKPVSLHTVYKLLTWIVAGGMGLGLFFGEKVMAQQPSVSGSSPRSGAEGLLRNAFVSCKLNLPTPGIGVDSTTLQQGIRLYPKDKPNQPVAVQMLLSNKLKNLTVEPVAVLEAYTTYVFEITAALKDQLGRPFLPYTSTFTTGNKDLNMAMNPTTTPQPPKPTADPFSPKPAYSPKPPLSPAPSPSQAPDAPAETAPSPVVVASRPPEAIIVVTSPDTLSPPVGVETPPVEPVMLEDTLAEQDAEPEMPEVPDTQITRLEGEVVASPIVLKSNWPEGIDSATRVPPVYPEIASATLDSLPLDTVPSLKPALSARAIGEKLQVAPASPPAVESAPDTQKPKPAAARPVSVPIATKPLAVPAPKPVSGADPELAAFEALAEDGPEQGEPDIEPLTSSSPASTKPTLERSSDYAYSITPEADTFAPPHLQVGGLAATSGESTVTVKWFTSEEYRQGFFRVERSADGIKFEPVKIITSPGNSDSLRVYTVEDFQPHQGLNYYRVMVVNRLNIKDYLSPVQVIFNGRQPVAFPQRNVLREGKIKVNFDLAQAGQVSVMVKAKNNRIVKRISGTLPAGKGTREISLKGVPPGVYLLGIRAEGKIFTHKIQVLY